jgi:probable HAF family extracellular repeat protein
MERSTLGRWFRVSSAALVVAVAGCGSSALDDEEFGVVLIALAATPSDVSCLEIRATGTRQVVKRFEVTPGTSASFEVAGLPLGEVQFTGLAFAAPCASHGDDAPPTWTGDAVTATIVKDAVARVTLVMRRNGRASIALDFEDCVGVVDVATLFASLTVSAIDMNNHGQIVGTSATGPEPFLWSGGVMRTLGTGSDSTVVAINDKGQVAGTKSSRAFLWEDGVVSDIGDLGSGYSIALGINEAGQVMGISWTDASLPQHAFIWQRGSTMVDLGTLGGSYSNPVAINESGQIVGESGTSRGEPHAFLWQAGVMRDLGTLGGSLSMAMAINDAGRVAGMSDTAGSTGHLFLWEAGLMRDLGGLGGDTCYARALNDAGQLVGDCNLAPGGSSHAFVWEAGVMRDLGTFGGLMSRPIGHRSLNASGEVVGLAEVDGGEDHAFLWKSGTMHDLGITGRAVGINDAHQVFGYTQTMTGQPHGFFFDVNACNAGEMPAGGR